MIMDILGHSQIQPDHELYSHNPPSMQQDAAARMDAVLGELHWRLKLIKSLTDLVDDSSSDELHDIQLLFERGFWIFGPEYEAVDFMANRTLATVVKEFLKRRNVVVSEARKRPDIITLPAGSISLYSISRAPAFGDFGRTSVTETAPQRRRFRSGRGARQEDCPSRL